MSHDKYVPEVTEANVNASHRACQQSTC